MNMHVDRTTPTEPPESGGSALLYVYVVDACVDYEGGVSIAVFADRGKAEALALKCEEYEKTRPSCPDMDAPDTEWEQYHEFDCEWREQHPCGGSSTGSDRYTVSGLPYYV